MLGIDLRVSSVKVAEIGKNNSGFTLKKWGMTEVPYQLIDKHPQLEEAKAEALLRLLRTNDIRSRQAIVVVGGNETLVRVINLSDIPPAEITQAIRWKLSEEVSFPIEDAIIDFYPLSQKEPFSGNTSYVCACISRKLFLETQYVLNRAGIKLVGITVLPVALQELYQEELAKSGEEVISIIYMGKRTTNISIFRHGNFEFNRELDLGGENITLAMSGIVAAEERRIEITPEEAEKLKLKYGIPADLEAFPKLAEVPPEKLQAMVRPALEKIQIEILRTFEYYKGLTGQAKIDKIILTGGSSQTPHLSEFLSEGMSIPIVTPKPFPNLNPRLAAALGAAIAGPYKINLLPEEIKHRFRKQLQKLTNPKILLPLFVGFLTLIYLYFWLQAFSLQRELDHISKKMAEYQPRLAQLEAIQRAALGGEQKGLAIKSYEEKKTKMPLVFEEISRLIPESIHLNSLNMTPDEIHLWGTVFKKDDAAENILSRFVLALSGSPVFENVQLIQAVKNNNYHLEAFNFEIVAKIRIK